MIFFTLSPRSLNQRHLNSFPGKHLLWVMSTAHIWHDCDWIHFNSPAFQSLHLLNSSSFLMPRAGHKNKKRDENNMEIRPDSMNTNKTVHPLGLKWDAFSIRLMPVLSPDLVSVQIILLKISCCYPHKLEELQTAKYHQSPSEFSRTPIQKDPGLNVRMRDVRKISNVLKWSLTALRVGFDVSSSSKMNKDLMSEGIWIML